MKIKRIILIIFILVISGCAYDEYEMPKDAYINVNDKIYEVYDKKAKIYDLIGDNNVEILTKNSNLDTTKVNDNIITIRYKYKRRKYKLDINYKVVDTTKPVFLSSSEYESIFIGEEKDFCLDISYADNYDKEAKCFVEGTLDNMTEGTYNLKYVIKDSSENIEEKPLYVTVVDPEKSYDDNSYSDDNNYNYEEEYLLYTDMVKKYKTEKTMMGIDVSYWQQDIDFEKVKNDDCEFVIIRLGVNTDVGEDISIDSFFKQNIKNAKKAGLKVGVYVYTSAVNEEMAIEHAKWIVKTLNKEKLDFPIAFDFENWKEFKEYKVSTYDVTNAFLTFKNYLNKKGYDSMLYSSMNYLYKVWMFNDTYKVWLAHYTDQTTYTGKYIMWQMASDGRINGINGNVDIDIYYKE